MVVTNANDREVVSYPSKLFRVNEVFQEPLRPSVMSPATQTQIRLGQNPQKFPPSPEQRAGLKRKGE